MSPGTIVRVKRGMKTRGRGALPRRHAADLASSPLMMDPRASSSHNHNQQRNTKEQQRIIILQSIRSIRATIMTLPSNNNYNDYFGAELDDLIGNLEDDNERMLFADFDDGGDLLTTPTGSAGMDFQFEPTDYRCDDDVTIPGQTSSIVTPMKVEEYLSRPHQERQQSFQSVNAVDNFSPSTQHHQNHHLTHPHQSESCSELSMSSHSMQSSSTFSSPSPVVNVDHQGVNVNQHQGSDSESFSFQQQEEDPYTKVQYDKALQNLAESMKRTEVSRRQIMMLKRTETTRRHVTMARVMLSHEQQRVLHLAKMKLNQQQQQQMPQQVQQGQPPQEQLQQQNPLQRQTLSSPMVASFFSNSSSATGGSSRSSFANTMDQGRKRISMYMGQVNHTL
mmetsp:Transcript_29985/g.64647  ORF Transcript_29985/g.64647 Transcript_29985/m.64647 type:complete len:392 (-) Transcript_29985:370-1545(-)